MKRRPDVGSVLDRSSRRRFAHSTAVLLGFVLLCAVGVLVVGIVAGPHSQFVVAGQSSGVTANCTLSDQEAPPGTNVTLYAFDSTNADTFRYDKEGDGVYDTDTITDEFYTFEYTENGTYTPTVKVRNDTTGATDTDTCGTLTIDANEPPSPELSYSPTDPDVGQQMTFDSAGTSDPDGDDVFFYEYDWDDDGTYEGFTETESTITHTYETRGSKTVTLRVEDEHDATATTSVTFFVGDREPIARCSVSSESVHVGTEVTVDASASENTSSADFDVDGDSEYEYLEETDLTTTHTYETTGTYEVSARLQNGDRTNETACGTVTVSENTPPTANLTISPSSPVTGESVTFDASGSSDSDGTIETYRWDFDNDGTIDSETNDSTDTYQYDTSGSYVPSVTVIDDDGATAESFQDLFVEDSQPPPTTLCSIEDTTATVGGSTTVDASGSDGPTTVEFDTDNDGTYERSDSEDFIVDVSYEEPGEYTVVARGTNEGGSDTAECGTITVDETGTESPLTDPYPTTTPREGTDTPFDGTEREVPTTEPDGDEPPQTTTAGNESGLPLPAPPEGLVPVIGLLVGLAGLGGAAYYFIPTGGGGGDGSGRLPKPPSTPSSSSSAAFETGTFLTPPESGPVTVTGLGFRPDLVTLVATTNVRPTTDSWRPGRSDGWCHGRAIRASDGAIPQTVATLTDDTHNVDAAMGVSSDGHAVELDIHTDAPPERVTGRVTSLTDDGFEMDFDVSGLPDDRAGDQYVVHYQAFSFGADSHLEIGHFQTPEYPGSQSIPLGIDADHVILTATNALETVDDRRMTDLPVGFSHGEVVGREAPAQFVRNTTADPAGPGGTARAAFDDRALHLLYVDGEIRGRTTATVTSLGDSIDLEYEKVYSGPAKLGSVESKLVTYVAIDTGALQPTIGHFQLPDADERVATELGFEPRLVEFTTLGIHDLNTDEMSQTSPLGFDWSHGSVIGGREASTGVRQYVLNDALDAERSTYEPGNGASHDGVAAAVRSLADGGHISSRSELTVTGFTDDGFEFGVTDIGGDRPDDRSQPYVFYKAWPDPDDVSE